MCSFRKKQKTAKNAKCQQLSPAVCHGLLAFLFVVFLRNHTAGPDNSQWRATGRFYGRPLLSVYDTNVGCKTTCIPYQSRGSDREQPCSNPTHLIFYMYSGPSSHFCNAGYCTINTTKSRCLFESKRPKKPTDGTCHYTRAAANIEAAIIRTLDESTVLVHLVLEALFLFSILFFFARNISTFY